MVRATICIRHNACLPPKQVLLQKHTTYHKTVGLALKINSFAKPYQYDDMEALLDLENQPEADD